jgi:acyl-CoA synthetase (AMP-forming)/AMP-acid ligase II
MHAADLLASEFAPVTDILRARAAELGDSVALSDPNRSVSWTELDALVDRVAARLQADGIGPGDTVAIAGSNAVGYVLALFGTLRTGAAAALLTTSASDQALLDMLLDSGARHLFLDRAFVGNHRQAEGHRPEPWHAHGSYQTRTS